jgi:hypothetical protein
VDDLDNLLIQACVQIATHADNPAREWLGEAAIKVFRHQA